MQSPADAVSYISWSNDQSLLALCTGSIVILSVSTYGYYFKYGIM